jgi:aldehyde dehydrogenase (NAD+)
MDFLNTLGLSPEESGVSTGQHWLPSSGNWISSISPVDGKTIGQVRSADRASYEASLQLAESAFQVWRTMPAPQRGEVVRQMGDALRSKKDALGRVVS